MAWQVLIVDDLPIIADSLAQLMERYEPVQFEVHKAYSGEEALQALRAETDIVISDIKMPGMDGIQLLEAIRPQWPHCKVIFLSGYDEFQYAQKALTLGAFDYVLKADGNEKVFAAAERAVTALEKERDERKLFDRTKEQLRLSLPSMRREFIWELMNGGEEKGTGSWTLADLGASLDPSFPVLLLVGRIGQWPALRSLAESSRLLADMQDMAGEMLGARLHYLNAVYERNEMVWLIQPGGFYTFPGGPALTQEAWEQAGSDLAEAAEAIRLTVNQRFGLSVSFALINEPVAWSRVSKAFHQLRMLMIIGKGSDEVISGRGIPDLASKPEKAFYKAQLERLQKSLESGGRFEFFHEYDALVDSVWRTADQGLNLELHHAVASLLLSEINRLGIPEDVYSGVYDRFQAASDRLHVFQERTSQFYREIAAFIFERKSQAQEEPGKHVVQLVHKYVEANMNRYFSLSEIADHVNLNRTYLSRLYKQLTGEGVYDYVNRAKLEQAKEKLLHTNMKVQDVAASLGYLSAMSFIRFFKTQTGLSPQEYREQGSRPM
ncbi:response regulator transcription factor [Paenibacillus contaminans]|uniref:DNA-binding response regulator n=1 Tax=Paenibacillus contaminans TaxID=450362 RepID=A0A329M673_9BACL|nr:response regulator [Paenibacillus contaminans]RAV15629.1 hypothetical protein DQG23_30105 [Paenibacillus contaminans]